MPFRPLGRVPEAASHTPSPRPPPQKKADLRGDERIPRVAALKVLAVQAFADFAAHDACTVRGRGKQAGRQVMQGSQLRRQAAEAWAEPPVHTCAATRAAAANQGNTPGAGAPAWKHSQYFFKQPLFLQLQPLLWRAPPERRLSVCRVAGWGWEGGHSLPRGLRIAMTPSCHAQHPLPAVGTHNSSRRPLSVCTNTHTHPATAAPAALTPPAILGRKAFGLRSRMASTAACRVASCSRLLWQLMQLQPSQ
jgi:hypothetical protein